MANWNESDRHDRRSHRVDDWHEGARRDSDYDYRDRGRDTEDYGRDYGRDLSRRGDQSRGEQSDRDYGRNETFHGGADYGSYGRTKEQSFGGGSTFGRAGEDSWMDRFSGGDRGRGGEMSRETAYGSDYGYSDRSQNHRNLRQDDMRRDLQRDLQHELGQDRGRRRDRNDDSYRDSPRTHSGTSLGYGNDYERNYDQGFGHDYRQGYRHDYTGRDYSAGLFSSPGEFSPSTGMGGMGRALGLDADDDSWGKTAPTTDYSGRGPKNWRRSDERIREDVSEALERDPKIDASEIEVDVKDGVVILKGSVEHRRHKRMSEDVIDMIPGVKDIRNEVSVNQSLFEQAKEMLTGESSSTTKVERPSRSTSTSSTSRH
jgi:hypothetical protein